MSTNLRAVSDSHDVLFSVVLNLKKEGEVGELLVVLGLPPRSSRLPVTRRSPNRTDRVGRSRRSSRISHPHHPLNKKRANRQVEMVEQRREEVEGEEEEGEGEEEENEGRGGASRRRRRHEASESEDEAQVENGESLPIHNTLTCKLMYM